MTIPVETRLSTRRRFRAAAIAVALALAVMLAGASALVTLQAAPQAAQAPAAAAQASAPMAAKKALTIDDYTKWRAIAGQKLSGNGTWVAYTLALTNTIAAEAKPVLHIVNLETNAEVTVADATDAEFSPDSAWIAYQVDPGAAQRARAARNAGAGATPPGGSAAAQTGAPAAASGQPGQSGPPAQPGQAGRGGGAAAIPPRRVELRNLQTGAVRSWQDIGSFVFSPASTHLVLRRRAAESAGAAGGRGGGAPGGGQGGGRGGGGATSPAGPGNDALLLDLRTGGHQLLGSVAEIAFNRTGELLAYTVNAAVKDGDGVFVFDTRNGRTTVLDNDAKLYGRLAWNEAGTGLAVLKGNDVERMRERDNVLVAFPDITAALKDGAAPAVPVTLDVAKADGLPKGWVISDRAALSWSEDNARVFFGVKAQVPAEDTTRRSTDETPNVDVWNTSDDRVQSLQMIRATQDRNFTFRSAFDVTAKQYIRLADETMKDLDVAPDGKWGVGRDERAYLADEKKLPAADFYRVNLATGERTLIAKGLLTGRHVFGISPHGTHFLYWKDAKVQAYDLNAGTTRQLGGTTAPSFIDLEDDHPGTKPSYGVAGYASDGASVIVNHRYDLWRLPLDGSAATNLTGGLGTKSEMRFRLIRTAPPDPTLPRAVGPRGTFDLTKPLTLSAYGQWTKKAGFYELAGGQMKPLVYEDASFSTPVKAMKADRFLFTRQTFVEFPDLRVSGPGFADAKTITDANPQQKDFLWGRRLLFDYKNRDGVRLQGILAIPDDYKPGEKRPMIVTFYEKNSQNMHVYTPPVYMVSMGRMPTQATSAGYLTMMPDVHFRTGSSHSDMLECVEAATRKVIELGYADPARIGVTGHSYGGEGAAYVGVMSKMFAAVGMGAGVVDLYNDFAMNWGWSYAAPGGSGDTAFNYYLYDQGRWGFSPWDQPDRYRSESALTWAPRAVAPFLIMHGTSDPTVGFINGLAFYNALRYNGKKAVLLAYPNEGHHLAGLANQRDLTVRFMEFFDHYLKGAKAPAWLTDGVPYLKKDERKDPPKPEPAPASTAQPEATSLLGRPLYAIELAPDAKQAVEARVAAAREALARTPDSPDAILWLGRQTAAAGRVRLAIDIFTKGIAQFPADPRLYRHRGHRYVTVREFDKAVADLAKAAQLIKGKPDQPEPSTADAKVISSETLHYAIYYHLGLAHYLKGDFAAALPVYQQCLAAAKAHASDDLIVGASDWLYMTLRRMGRPEDAAKVLEPIVPGMKVKDDQQYYDRLMMYKGAKTPEALLSAGKDAVSEATLAYGVANWHLYNGRKDEAKALFQKIVTGPNWMPFGFIGAEAELARMK